MSRKHRPTTDLTDDLTSVDNAVDGSDLTDDLTSVNAFEGTPDASEGTPDASEGTPDDLTDDLTDDGSRVTHTDLTNLASQVRYLDRGIVASYVTTGMVITSARDLENAKRKDDNQLTETKFNNMVADAGCSLSTVKRCVRFARVEQFIGSELDLQCGSVREALKFSSVVIQIEKSERDATRRWFDDRLCATDEVRKVNFTVDQLAERFGIETGKKSTEMDKLVETAPAVVQEWWSDVTKEKRADVLIKAIKAAGLEEIIVDLLTRKE